MLDDVPRGIAKVDPPQSLSFEAREPGLVQQVRHADGCHAGDRAHCGEADEIPFSLGRHRFGEREVQLFREMRYRVECVVSLEERYLLEGRTSDPSPGPRNYMRAGRSATISSSYSPRILTMIRFSR